MQLSGKVYAVTGGASGIGLAVAKILSERGAIACISDVNADALKEVETYFSEKNATFFVTKVDVSKRDEVDAWIDEIVRKFGRLDGAANVAGIIGKGHGIKSVAELDDGEWDKIMAVNLTGFMYCLRKELQQIADGGSIVNVSSIHGTKGIAYHGAYAASKHGMIGLTRAAAKENGAREIRINAVAPGSIYTPMMQGWWDANNRPVDAPFSEPTAFQKLGTPKEVAKLIAFLLGPDSTFISGLLVAAVGVIGAQLPSLTGRYPVGTVNLELIDYSRIDPLAPSPQLRDLMVSVFYPTLEGIAKSSNYSFSPYITPITEAGLAPNIGTSEEILRVITQAHLGAPIRNNDFPVLIFSPGFGGTRKLYTTLLEDLASQGWIIIAVDHTYDSVVVEFPDGRNISWLSSFLDDFPSQMPRAIEIRVEDVEFIARAFSNSTILSQIPGLADSQGVVRALRTDHIGIFGHSLDGATAAQAAANSSTFVCGANIDGGIYGPVGETGLSKPFLQIEAQDHDVYDNTTDDFYNHLSGFCREFKVNGTVHLSFTDFPVLRGLLGEATIPETSSNLTQFGTINGERLMEIETALMDDFFGFCLEGRSVDKLDSLAQSRFPELSIP